jgi:hypothetical protein
LLRFQFASDYEGDLFLIAHPDERDASTWVVTLQRLVESQRVVYERVRA